MPKSTATRQAHPAIEKPNQGVVSFEATANHFFLYWRPKNVETRLVRHPLLNNAGSSQFRYVKPDDVLWFVTVREGKLFLVGKLIVGEITDWKGATRILGDDVAERSRFLVIAKPGTEEYMQDIPLEDITQHIRFDSPSSDRFVVMDARLNPQQMQMKRKLTAASCELVTAKWHISRTNSKVMEGEDIES